MKNRLGRKIPSLEEALIEAAKKSDMKEVQRLIKEITIVATRKARARIVTELFMKQMMAMPQLDRANQELIRAAYEKFYDVEIILRW